MEPIIEPLVDLQHRILCLSSRTPVPVVVDRLLRLQSAPEWRRPITLYLTGAEDDTPMSQRSLSALEFLQLHSVIRALRSPVEATALGGILRGFEPLVLASCAPGRRHLLPSALICVGPLDIGDLPLSNSIGLGNHQGQSLREQARELIRAQLDHILEALNLTPGLWQRPLVLTASAAVAAGLADAIVPIHTPVRQPEEERNNQPTPERF